MWEHGSFVQCYSLENIILLPWLWGRKYWIRCSALYYFGFVVVQRMNFQERLGESSLAVALCNDCWLPRNGDKLPCNALANARWIIWIWSTEAGLNCVNDKCCTFNFPCLSFYYSWVMLNCYFNPCIESLINYSEVFFLIKCWFPRE